MKTFLKKIIPKSLIRWLLNIKKKVPTFFFWMSSTNLTAGIYYTFSGAFAYEHKAVLKGRKAYQEALKDIGLSCALLRRNTHRIEKGLIMRPRRSVFGEGFIEETVLCYRDAMKTSRLAPQEKKWATDVLDEYFNIVGSTPTIDNAKSIYLNIESTSYALPELVAEFPSPDSSYKPYPYKQLPDAQITFDELKQLFIRRRSVRWYQDKPVPLELVQKASNIASFAPSACNRQPYRFLFCNEKEKAVAIAKCAGGTKGFADNLPSIIAVVGDLSSYPYERDRHLIYIDGALAAMQLMLALETLGLSTCSINWPEVDANERQLRKLVNLKDYERVVMLMAVGYAESTGGVPYSQKKENQLILEDISK